MTGINMKKNIFVYINLFTIFIFTGCFLEVGYWQQLTEMLDRGTEVSSMPDYSEKFSWISITKNDAQELWDSSGYRENIKTAPSTANIYQKESNGSIRKYSSIPVDKFPNWIYSREIAEYIYVFKFNSQIDEENLVKLNYYIPSKLPESTKIYKDSKDNAFVKMEIPCELNNYGEEENKTVTGVFIFKKGLLIQQDITVKTFIEY